MQQKQGLICYMDQAQTATPTEFNIPERVRVGALVHCSLITEAADYLPTYLGTYLGR